MTQSIVHYVDVSVVLSGTGPQPAGFGTPMFLHTQDSVGASSRLHGPFTSVASVVDFGYAVGSPPHAFATALFSQQPRATSFYVGRGDTGDANVTESLTEIVAANPSAFYAIAMENRDEASILELAAFVEPLRKIAIAQSSAYSLYTSEGPTYGWDGLTGTLADGTFTVTFTGFGLSSPVAVETTRSTTPADLDAMVVQIAADIATEATSGDLVGFVDPSSVTAGTAPDGTTSDATALSLEVTTNITGTITVTAGTTGINVPTITTSTDGGLGRQLFDANYTRTALCYYDDDAVYLDAAWMSRCLSFNLDQRKGIWANKRLNGIAGSSLTDAQVTNLRNRNINYFAPAQMTSGQIVQAFTAQGWFPSGDAAAGRRIDVTTSLDWLHARSEEALAGVTLAETHGVRFNDAGIRRYKAAEERVLRLGVAAGHLANRIVPDGEDYAGTQTPAAFAPLASELTTTERTNRTMTFNALAYLESYIEKVIFSLQVNQ